MEYPIKFKAAILEQNNKPLVVDEVIFEGPLDVGQVLIRIHYSGICGKQIEEIRGSSGHDPYLPHMLGHEGAGVVVDVGPGVRKVAVGDRVVLHWMKGSGIDAVPPLYIRGGKRINAGWVTTFNEYGVISENRVTPILKEFDLMAAALMGCAVTTGVGVILNDANLKPGDSVAVFGCGGVGLAAIQGAVLQRGDPIIAVDKNLDSLKQAIRFGANKVIDSGSSNVLAEIREITAGRGVKYVIVATGDTQIIEVAVESSSIPGTVFFVGVPPRGAKISVDAFNIHMKRTITGSCGGSTFPDNDIPRYLRLNQEGLLKLKELISKVISLDNINEGTDFMMTGINTGRCIVKLV